MRTFGYVVLEYAQSDLDDAGKPVVIVLHDEVDSTIRFRLYVLREWKDLILPTDVLDREYIEDFIYELHQLRFRDAIMIEQFIRSIQSINVGPLRTSDVGLVGVSAADEHRFDLARHIEEVTFCQREQFEQFLDVFSPTHPSR